MRIKTKRKNVRKKSKSAQRPSPLGLFQALIFGVGFYVVSLLSAADPSVGSQLHAQSPTPSFRPIGSESLVDRYVRRPSNTRDPNIRQVAMQSGGFEFPTQGAVQGGPSGGVPNNFSVPNQFSPPPLNTPPALSSPPANLQPAPQPPSFATPSQPLRPSAPALVPRSQTPQVLAPQTPSANLPNNFPPARSPAPRTLPNFNPSSMADYQPVPPPQISNGGFATMGDCRLITPPSSYTAMSPYGASGGCGVAPTSYAGPYSPPPAQIAAPAAMPPAGFAPQGAPGAFGQTGVPGGSPMAAPVGSLVTFGQENYAVQVGQGLWGQPVAYVPGQSFRNWLRYMSF